jgi:pimeloyl-ACP methyl ester carboxylesterase/uncharacterized membrane protein YphA (DoxX/SURF4 family)
VTDTALTRALRHALLALRFTLGLFLLQWGVEKFVAPQSALAIWGHFYGVTLPQLLGYLFGVIEIAIAACFFLGAFRTVAYGAAFLVHAVTVAVSWRQLLDPWGDPVNHLFIASIPVLGALLALFLLRHWDRGVLDRDEPPMIARRHVLTLLIALVLSGCSSAPQPATGTRATDRAVAALGAGFVSDSAAVNGTVLHYVRGGSGPAVILLHGFPQDWYEYHQVMPRLTRRFTVVAVDLRGIGGSTATAGGYEAANLAEDIRQLSQRLQLARPYLVGHDMGAMVAYAFVRRFPDAARGVMLLDVPLPGIEPWDKVVADPLLWHINFHQTPGLPEQLIAGRQAIYFRHFFNLGTVNHAVIGEAHAAHYVKAYGAPEQLRAAFELYRALPANARFNASQRDRIDLPLVLAGGDHGFGPLLPGIAETLRAYGWQHVTTVLIENSGHYVADEQPEAVAELIERHAS